MQMKKYKIEYLEAHKQVFQRTLNLFQNLHEKKYATVFEEVTPISKYSNGLTPVRCSILDRQIKKIEGYYKTSSYDIKNKKIFQPLLDLQQIFKEDKSNTIILTEDQVKLLSRYSELYSRFGVRQYKIVFENIIPYNKKILDWDELDIIEKSIRNMEWFTLPPNASLGIYMPVLDVRYQISYENNQVLRYVVSWANAEHSPPERNKYFSKYMTVNFDQPRNITGTPLIKCYLIT